jgi:hypothetical protein
MKLVTAVVAGWPVLATATAASASGPRKPQKLNTAASLHGLSVVNAKSLGQRHGGTFVRTTDEARDGRRGCPSRRDIRRSRRLCHRREHRLI